MENWMWNLVKKEFTRGNVDIRRIIAAYQRCQPAPAVIHRY